MNKAILFGVFLLTLFSLSIQSQQVQGKDGVVRNPVAVPSAYLGESEAFRDVVIDTTIQLPVTKHPKLGYHSKDDWFLNPTINPNALPKNGDPIVQKEYSSNIHRSTEIANWAGIVTNTNPGDPAMDVGPNHVVQMMNGASGSQVQIWDKSGTTLLGPSTFSTMVSGTWSGRGDPIVLYDERADRWILTEFCNGCNDLYIAISTTPDPLGSYDLFSVTASSFPDYPKYSIWDNSYVITANEGSTNSTVYILDRTSMLGGGATNAQQFFIPRFGTIGFQAATPVSLMGTTTSGTPSLLMRMRDDAWTGSASDALEMWELDIDWSSPGAATLSQVQTIPVSAHETELCGYTSFSCIPQPGGNDLDPLRELLMNRIMYRNFGSYESIVCAHVTDVDGNDLAGIRWYELRRTGGGAGTWSVYQEGTYSPSDGLNRWMPTIGISASGNIGLAYNVSSSTTHPEIRYTGRKECDPLGVMTETEEILVDGTANNNSNRWGDYNAMGVDPVDGETFWFTATYNPATQARSRIGAFKIDPCNPQVQFNSGSYTVNESDASTTSGCLDYYTLDVPVTIALDPSQPADITVNITGGSATQNVDYTISNTTFTLDGTTLTGIAQVIIYNDNNTEGNETITLDYTLNANGGDAVAGTLSQTVTITIIDDDLDPLSSLGITQTILQEDFETGFGTFSTNNPSGDTPWQIGDEATAESGPFNIPSSNTTDFAWINDDVCNCDQNDVDLLFPSVDLSNYLAARITFDSYFEGNTWNGDTETAELHVSIGGGAFNLVGSLTASQIDVDWIQQSFDLTPYVGNADVQFAINYSDGTGYLYGCTIDNILIEGEQGILIQTAVNTGSGLTANFGPNETVHFYDPTSGDVMLSLVNTSSFDYGCVTVEVDRDGTTPTALEFASAPVADYLHGKTYTVVPTNNSATGSYDVTLYYEEAEVAAWEGTTGNSRNDLEIIKVAGNNRIDDVTPGNYASYTIDNIAASLGTFYSDVTLTASFSNGFSGFGAGIYNVSTVSVTHTASGTDPACNGASSGSINFTPSGGTAPYEYSVDGGATWTSTNPVTGLVSGTYSTMVRDAGLNQSTASPVTLTDPTAISMSSSSTDPTCSSGTGSITITATGGTGSLQYSIDGGSNFQPGGSFTGLTDGTYNIVVEDANGCQAIGSETISVPNAITMSSSSTDPSCSTGTGSITITASGGTGSLQYSIDGGSNFQSSGSFTGLSNGTYSIVVEDANSCQETSSETISIPTVIAMSSTSTDASCGNSDGTITITASGGTGTLQYSIDGGATFQAGSTFTGLSANTYNLVTEDANNCQVTGTETVANAAGPNISGVSANDVSCNGGTDGDITITATGTATLQYSVDGGATFQTLNNFSALSANTYNIVVEDGNGCQTTSTDVINEPAANTFSTTPTSPSCFGGSDGSISFSGATGPNPKRYSIDGGATFQVSNNFSGLPAGTYNVAMRDGNNCIVYSTEAIVNPTAITISSTATDENCGNSDGTLTITASGGSGSLQYSIDGGANFQAGGSFTGLSNTVYNIVVEDANGCQETGTQIVGINNGPSITSVSDTDVSCFGGNDGSITFTASGLPTMEYSVDGGGTWQTSSTVANLTANSYSLYIRDGAGCQLNVGTLSLTQPNEITYTVSSTDEICGNANGSLMLSGAGTLDYSINGGTNFQSSGNFTGLTSGSYNIVIEDAAGCQTTGTENVGFISGPSITNETGSDATCNAGSDGSISITATGTASLEYSIDGGSSYSSSNTFSGLIAGSYDIMVRDGNSCETAGSTLTIDEPTAITYTANINDASCGGNDGDITLSGSGGTGSLEYSIDGGSNFQSSGSFTNLTTGTYNIVIQDASSCQTTGTESVGSTSGPSITNESSSDVSCNGAADGSITVTATGVATLEYSIDGGVTYSTSTTFNGLTGGNYNVVVRDGNGCVTNGSTINIDEATAISYSVNTVDASCGNSNGSITLTASGGTGALQYSIDGGSNFQSGGLFTSLADATYNILIEDAAGCQTSGTEIVNTLSGPVISAENGTDISCLGTADGSISITASGTATLEYSIDGGTTFTTSNTFSGLSASSYDIVVRDGNGCSTIGSTITISSPSAIIYSASTSDASCGSSNGSITITASGGTGSLMYSIDGGSNFQSTGSFIGLSTGTYNIVIEDVNGCQETGSEIIGSASGPSITNQTSTDVICNGADNGTISISASGTGSIEYSIDGGSTFGSSGLFTGLSSGTYNVVVRDGNGCITAGNAIVIIEPVVISYSTTVNGATCGVSDGEIIITASGGTGSLQYSIDGGTSFQSNGTFSNLNSGSYGIVIEDVNGCQATSLESINSVPGPTIMTSASNDISCFGIANGSVTIVATGASPLSYSIDGGVTYQSSGSFTNLSDGTYIVSIQDVNGCMTNSTTLSVNEPSAIAINSSTTNSTCGNNDGSIIVMATGGTGAFQFSIDAGSSFQTNGTFPNVTAGTYDIVIEDANGCQALNSATIVNTDGPVLSNITITDESCFGANDGAVFVNASGASPLSYSINGGTYQSSPNFGGITGSVDVDVQDGNSCVTSTTVTIEAATDISLVSSSTDATCGQDNGTVTVIATGGTGAFSYLWDDDQNQANNVAIELAAGSYSVLVTDENGCIDSTTVSISSGSTMTVNVDVTHESCPEEEDGLIVTAVTGGQTPYAYSWSNGDSTAMIENLSVGDYTLTVSDADECIVTLIIPIENEGGDCIHIPTAISPNSDGANDTWVIGGLEDYPDALVEVYNRWGSLLFSSDDYQHDWDGTYEGSNVSAGVYYYVISIDEETTYTGSITVIR